MIANHKRSLPTLLSSWRYGFLVLYPANRPYVRLLGSHYPEPDGPCRYVLVLLPERAGHSHMVEGMDYSSSDPSIRY